MPKELTPTFTVISKACDGDETAISKILEFYDPYINQCCMQEKYRFSDLNTSRFGYSSSDLMTTHANCSAVMPW